MSNGPDEFLQCSNGPLPRSMESRAYFSDDRREFALCRSDALEYLRWCEDNGLKVLGFDIWMPTRPGPTVVDAGGFNGDAFACRTVIQDYPGDPVFNIWAEP